jgi:beta-lactamase regulating signal transducer with metallopeptidase domain
MVDGTAILDAIVESVWRASWQGAALAVAVLAVVGLLRNRLSPAWRYGLWSLVLVRLFLPIAPQARWSPFNLVEGWGEQTASDAPDPFATTPRDNPPRFETTNERIDPTLVEGKAAVPLEAPDRPVLPASASLAFNSRRSVALVWLSGAILMAVWMGCRWWRLRQAAGAWPEVADRHVLDILVDCQDRLGLRRLVRLCVAPGDTGPAVLGVWRPRIVLPEVVLHGFGRDRLEAILLHELAHVRRRDVVVHWLMMAARVLHWFNPIAWLALSRMAAERELACDDVVIDVLGPSSRRLYGETMLRLLERLVVGPTAPGVVHFFGSNRRLRMRLESLARPARFTSGGRTLAITLLLGLALLGLTDSIRSRASAQARDAIPAPRLGIDAPAAAVGPVEDPTDVRLQGRVLDHLGEPVRGADVLLLGRRKLTVYVLPSNMSPRFRLGWSTPAADEPRSVKTDDQGRFIVRDSASASNRVAVVSDRVWLTEVPLERISDRADATIRLPEPGSIRIRCDIPHKPAKQEFQVTLRTVDGVDWEPDVIYMRDLDVPNPGQEVIGSLPTAQYVIERINSIDRGSWGTLATFCERTLVPVATGRTTDVDFDRRIGRPVTGRVRGLDNVKLRFAYVSVGYLGPPEAPSPQGRRQQMLTHFDVIPIGLDGRFVTPPLPPGHYDFELSALHAATPRAEVQSPDFQGNAQIDVPAEGEIPPVEIVAKTAHPDPRHAPKPRDRATELAAHERALRNARELVDQTYKALEKEHEFNDPRWPFIITVRDVQNRVLIDATFKGRGKSKGEIDRVMQARRAWLRVDPNAKVIHVEGEVLEIQGFGQNDTMMVSAGLFDIPILGQDDSAASKTSP